MLRTSQTCTSDTPRCLYFERGRCRKGKACPYSHERSRQTPDNSNACVTYNELQTCDRIPGNHSSRDSCQHFFNKGWCGYGNSCRFSHVNARDDEGLQGSLGASSLQGDEIGADICDVTEREQLDVTLPKESNHGRSDGSEQKPCRFYKSGHCRFGYRCRFQHAFLKHDSDTGNKNVLMMPSAVSQASQDAVGEIVDEQSETKEVSVTSNVDELSNRKIPEMDENLKSSNGKVNNMMENSARSFSSGSTSDQSQETTATELKPAFKFSDETLYKMRETEINQLRRRYPKVEEKTLEDGCTTLKFVFEPTDPDWPYDVKQMTLEVSFPARYPDEMMNVKMSDNERVPATVERCVNDLIKQWIADRHQSTNSSSCKELMFRPLMLWLDRKAEDLFTQALKEYKRELMAKAAGVQFIPASKLRQIYPEAASTKPPTTVTSLPHSQQENIVTSSQGAVAVTSSETENCKGSKALTDSDNGVETVGERKDTGVSDDKHVEQGDGGLRVSTTPSRKGTEVSLMSLQLLNGTATLLVSRVTLIVTCSRCTNNTELQMAPGHVYTATCARCHNPHVIELNANITHQMSSVIGYLNIEGCHPFDVVLADCQFQIGCLNCSKETLIDSVSPGQPNNTWCLHCHQKLTVVTEGVRFVQLTPTGQLDTSKAVRLDVKKQIKAIRDPAIQEGHPLPSYGTCKHFKKSFRWFRFPCCGKAYPCDYCHNEMEVDHIMKLANRTICGYCAKEQPYSGDRPCIACNSVMTNRSTDHWEGGKGCRDKIKMNRTDSKKYANLSKTLSRSTEQKLNSNQKTTKLRHV